MSDDWCPSSCPPPNCVRWPAPGPRTSYHLSLGRGRPLGHSPRQVAPRLHAAPQPRSSNTKCHGVLLVLIKSGTWVMYLWFAPVILRWFEVRSSCSLGGGSLMNPGWTPVWQWRNNTRAPLFVRHYFTYFPYLFQLKKKGVITLFRVSAIFWTGSDTTLQISEYHPSHTSPNGKHRVLNV